MDVGTPDHEPARAGLGARGARGRRRRGDARHGPDGRDLGGAAGGHRQAAGRALVTGGASPFADFADDVVAWSATAGAAVDRVHLPDHGVTGNGHALTYETDSDDTLAVVLQWLTAKEAS